jgi:hypothetical protein
VQEDQPDGLIQRKSLRISDIKNDRCVPLSELLTHIQNPDQLKWSLLWFDVIPIKDEGGFISRLTKNVNGSERGFYCDFDLLADVSRKIFQEIEILIIGCKTEEMLHRYEKDQKMYESCDIVMEMIDGGFWEIFSKNEGLIDQLSKKYKVVERLTSDFQDHLYPQ